ncbi:hypothetical protein GGTG_03944 [Gaeumannomyces tritici R3-111a-1]|uniref:Uncharacterized protein n=1 Tax=Gaeumannomyces tritici (strain R3-111a-1) TaxID=644352 RepID=J3NRP4_GAET3|nr:hypothetical protein GGTG_03944 [Gaeumannomyces tritici R3-111a-1]EJT78850.1 hypothetical protein GGTG_03944 [Gaeumannomyces tritici R3-111a-1]
MEKPSWAPRLASRVEQDGLGKGGEGGAAERCAAMMQGRSIWPKCLDALNYQEVEEDKEEDEDEKHVPPAVHP